MNKKIVLAGGCFWGLEDLIRSQPGVVTTEVGYTGGQNENPTWTALATGSNWSKVTGWDNKNIMITRSTNTISA
jgi:peptide methionine sulfoxide reductase MsrA